MKKKVSIEFHLDEIEGYDWLTFGDKLVNADNTKEAAIALKASPELVDAIYKALSFMANEIVTNTKADLKDLWDKLEDIEDGN